MLSELGRLTGSVGIGSRHRESGGLRRHVPHWLAVNFEYGTLTLDSGAEEPS